MRQVHCLVRAVARRLHRGHANQFEFAPLGAQAHRPRVDARIVAAQLVSPYRKQGASGKNDANNAAAICEAASRPQMHFVPVKSIEQQSMLCVDRLREG